MDARYLNFVLSWFPQALVAATFVQLILPADSLPDTNVCSLLSPVCALRVIVLVTGVFFFWCLDLIGGLGFSHRRCMSCLKFLKLFFSVLNSILLKSQCYVVFLKEWTSKLKDWCNTREEKYSHSRPQIVWYTCHVWGTVVSLSV